MSVEFKKTLNLLDLTIFGLNFMIPLAPAIVFGIIAHLSGGSVVLPYFVGFIAMLFTGYCFIRMSRKYPNAGSVFIYVQHSLGSTLGFIAGWMIIMDYLLTPAITTASAAIYLQTFFPSIPYSVLVLLFIALTGVIAISGVKSVSIIGLIILIMGELAVITSLFVWGHYVSHGGGVGQLISKHPFYFTSGHALLSASALAAMGYFGFDAISTMAEEAKNPRRNIPLAIGLALVIGALTMILTGYFGSLVQPDNSVYQNTNWQNEALFYISNIAGGKIFSHSYAAIFICSMIFLNVVATSAVSRIMFSMSREGKLPKIFMNLSDRFNTPYISILFILLLEIIVASSVHLELLGDLISFGALSGFILLNIGTLKMEIIDSPLLAKCKFIMPLLGTIILVCILVNINTKAIYAGVSWAVIGVVILFIQNKHCGWNK